jgi:hypothetical protein
MTRDNIGARVIPKPMECEMCGEFEVVQHLMFDYIVARALWNLVDKVFNILPPSLNKWISSLKLCS